MHTPDNWVVVKINGDDPHYRVLAGWSGGFATGDSWRMNSGIKEVIETDTSFEFIGASGSVYCCGKRSYGIRMNTCSIWCHFKDQHGDKVELMPENTNWSEVDWII